jgi:branched-chain amino acid transport system ATP-binding protein
MLDLGDALDHPVADLPPCDRKRAELARGLAAEPRLLLVDAPMAGLHRDDAAALVKRLSRLPKRVGVTVVLFEHHVHTVADDCDHVVVLDAGRKIAAGTAAEVTKHPEVVSAYLGGSAPADAESRRGKLIRLVAARRRAGAGA